MNRIDELRSKAQAMRTASATAAASLDRWERDEADLDRQRKAMEADPRAHLTPIPVVDLDAQITGTEAALENRRQDERAFVRVNTLDRQTTSLRVEVDDIAAEAVQTKTALAALKADRATLIAGVVGTLEAAGNAALPPGVALRIDLNDKGAANIGLTMGDGPTIDHRALSGGEWRLFEAALTAALTAGKEPRVLIVEAGELDAARLTELLARLGTFAGQCIVATCHPCEAPDGWTAVEVGA